MSFLDLHVRGQPLLMPNAWDEGSARVLEHLGFSAIATTSSGFAATLGRLDGGVTRDEALAHAATLVAAVEVPVSADLENGFGDTPEEVRRTVQGALAAGLAGCSIEDFTGREEDPIYSLEDATERIAAAVAAADGGLVLTARAENHLHGRDDLEDTIRRLRAYAGAGADVVFAPGLTTAEDIAGVIDAVERPLSVLALPGVPPVAELARLGVARVSVGGAFAFAALGAVLEAATELRDEGTYGYLARARRGQAAVRDTFRAQ